MVHWYVKIQILWYIDACVFGINTIIAINMNMFFDIRRDISIRISIGITESISIRKSICNDIN